MPSDSIDVWLKDDINIYIYIYIYIDNKDYKAQMYDGIVQAEKFT